MVKLKLYKQSEMDVVTVRPCGGPPVRFAWPRVDVGQGQQAADKEPNCEG